MASASIARADLFGNFRVIARITAMALALLLALPFHGLWRLVRAPSPWPMWLLAAVGWIAGARRHTIGRPLKRDVFFVSNHLSWLDIPVLAGRNGSAFIAKGELARVPLIGWLCRLHRTVFVDRGARMDIARQIDAIRNTLAETWAITIFPEGTTGDGDGLLPFKASLLAVLDPPPPGVLVQPVLVDYGADTRDIAWTGDEPGLDNVRRILARSRPLDATLTFLEPFDPADFPGRKAIAAEARRRMEAALA